MLRVKNNSQSAESLLSQTFNASKLSPMSDFASANSKTDPSEEHLLNNNHSRNNQTLPNSQNEEKSSQLPEVHITREQNYDYEEVKDHTSKTEERLPTVGQLMRRTSQDMLRLYKERLGKRPSKVTCDLVSEKLVIWIENSITPLERLLFESGDSKAQSLCSAVDEIMEKPIVEIIERHLQVNVVALVSDTSYEQACTGIIAKLSAYPTVRSSRRSH